MQRRLSLVELKKDVRLSIPSALKLPQWAGQQMSSLLALLIVLLTFSASSAPFRSIDNMMLIATDAATIGIVAVGQTMVLLVGGIDLSVGSMVAFTGVIAAGLMKGLGPLPPLPATLALPLALGLGAALGAAQGWLITARNMPPFIVTLAMMVVLRGLAQAAINSAPAPLHALPDDFKWLSDGRLGPLPAPALLMLTVYSLIWFILCDTRFGKRCYAIGSNEMATRLTGVSVDRHKIAVYAISGTLAALAGIVLIARINGAFYTNGEGYELKSIAAAVIGGTSLSGGAGGVWGTLSGVLLMATINNGLTMSNIPPEWQNVITGSVILLAMLIDVRRWRARKSAAQSGATQRLPAKLYLSTVLARLLALLRDRLGCQHCRVYLVDRASGALVQQLVDQAAQELEPSGAEGAALPEEAAPRARGPQGAVTANDLVLRASQSLRPIYVAEIGRAAGCQVLPLQPQVHSAVAVPLLVHEQLIGVLEAQSIVADGFSDEAIEALQQLGAELAPLLEDAWLLESGWLTQQLRDALRHLLDDLYLGRSKLARWWMPIKDAGLKSTPAARGEMLRAFLLSLIERLRPSEPSEQGHGRGYRVLWLTYVEGLVADEITRELHISRRQYFYDLKAALDTLADLLVREHQAHSKDSASFGF